MPDGRRDWPTVSAEVVPCPRLADCLSHAEVEVESCEDDSLRPTFTCKIIHEEIHAPFRGYNRAQAAVLELAILVSRLDRLPAQKIKDEINYLSIAVEKTAGPLEQEAWGWLMAHIQKHPNFAEAAL